LILYTRKRCRHRISASHHLWHPASSVDRPSCSRPAGCTRTRKRSSMKFDLLGSEYAKIAFSFAHCHFTMMMQVACSTSSQVQEGTNGVQHQAQRLWPGDQAPLCRLKVKPIAQRVLPGVKMLEDLHTCQSLSTLVTNLLVQQKVERFYTLQLPQRCRRPGLLTVACCLHHSLPSRRFVLQGKQRQDCLCLRGSGADHHSWRRGGSAPSLRRRYRRVTLGWYFHPL
jgi:hypothetical protein